MRLDIDHLGGKRVKQVKVDDKEIDTTICTSWIGIIERSDDFCHATKVKKKTIDETKPHQNGPPEKRIFK